MAITVYSAVDLEPVTCYSCSVIFGIPDDMYRRRKEDQRDWYCPNGHIQHFVGETDAQRFKRLWKQEQDTTAALRSNLDQTEHVLRATKGVVTKMRKRAITGTCAFCHRHFANVERHVASQHPTETPDGATA